MQCDKDNRYKRKKQIDMYLENIYSPADVKKLSFQELNDLSNEIRASLLQKLSEHGGHFGPNFGMVEATIALHYVFNSPEDKIVFDVSHQSYVHKMLTGRKDAFLYPAEYDNVSGYSEPHESKHDFLLSVTLPLPSAWLADWRKDAT